MARKSVIYGEYIITCEDGKEIHVTQIFNKAKPVLEKICKTHNLDYPESANTQQLGRIIVKSLGDGEQAEVDGYTVLRRPSKEGSSSSRPIDVSRDFPKGTVKAELRKIADKAGMKYDEAWNTQTLGSKLIDFIETGVQPEIKEKKVKEEKVESKHTVSLELAGYYNEVEYYVVPKDKQQQVLDFTNVNDNEEIGDALSDLCNSGTINLDGCPIELEKAAIYSFSPNAMIVRVEGDESEYPSEELHAYDFWNVDNNGNPMVSVPENCPAWLSEGYIKPLQKLVSQLSKNDDASDVLNSLDSEKSWADLTMPNIPKGMKIGILKSAKGVWSCNIELNDNEKFDFYKLESLFYSQNIEPTGIGELDAFPLTGIIYDNKYYDLEEEDCRYQDQKMWMVDSDEEQIWPREEDEDYDDEDY